MDECPHGLGDPQFCSICLRGVDPPPRKRSPSSTPKDGVFTCSVCGKTKNLDQVRTMLDKESGHYINNPDNVCRPCDKEIVAFRKENGGSRKEAVIRVTERYAK